MSRCERGWRSWRGRSRASRIATACFVGPLGRACEPQASASGLSGGRGDDPAEEAETLRARGQPLLADGGEPGMGAGFCARCSGVRTSDSSTERGGCVHARVLEVDTSFDSRRVTRVLEGIVGERGRPKTIRCDNGPERTSRHFLAWCVERQIELVHIQPGKPMQNAHIKTFHGGLREECLTLNWFQNLFDARRKIAAWKIEYNQERPHTSA